MVFCVPRLTPPAQCAASPFRGGLRGALGEADEKSRKKEHFYENQAFKLFPLSADLPGIGAAVRLPGWVEYIGKEDGKPYYESEAPEVLLVMNAMDGTVIG